MKILLAEDDPMIAEIYQRKFRDVGFEVMLAINGTEVLKRIQKEKVDLILLDMVLPDMNGFDVLEKINQIGKDPKTKIIVFSNLSSQDDQNKAFELGADGYILKNQFNPSEVVKEIEWRLNVFKEQEKNDKINENESKFLKEEKVSDKKSILFIEDEEVFLELFGEKLKKDGYEVEYAKNGAWGIKEAKRKHFDLIIMDVIMPAMDGIEMINQLKLEEKTKNIPIIVLSSSVDESEKKQIEKMGIKKFYIKTNIIPSKLSEEVKKLIG